MAKAYLQTVCHSTGLRNDSDDIITQNRTKGTCGGGGGGVGGGGGRDGDEGRGVVEGILDKFVVAV